MKVTTRWRKDYTGIVRVMRELETEANAAAVDIAEYLINDVRHSWHATSPSPEGGPPAIDHGYLDKGFSIEKQGRSLGGQFAAKDGGIYRFVSVDTRKSGRSYAEVVEEGSHVNPPLRGARPYLKPAVERAEGVLAGIVAPKVFKRYKRFR